MQQREEAAMNRSQRNLVLNALSLAALFSVLYLFKRYGTEYQVRILNNMGVFITLAVSYNLVNGVCGLLHLGPNAFITIGAYTSALLTMSPAEKQMSFIIEPLIWPLSVVQAPFVVSLLAGGVTATLFAFLISFPVLRVRGDYLAIVTLGFGEVVRVMCNALQGVTNGPLGIKGLAPYTDLW
jgi:branched-chain amino acid transport system permease protein